MTSPKPRVLLPCDNCVIAGCPSLSLEREYLTALREVSDVLPLPLPCDEGTDLAAYLELADGLLLTGAESNITPEHYGAPAQSARAPQDAARDRATLPLVRAALQRRLPLLAICRGLQEVNVALGGTLNVALHETQGLLDHRARGQTLAEQFAAAHALRIAPGGHLARWLGSATSMQVNSLHGQGIARLAPGLRAEAHAPDGVIECVSHTAAPFFVAVQWHPEWQAAGNPLSRTLFGAFGQACRGAA